MTQRRSFIAGMIAAGLVPKSTWADAGSPDLLSAGRRADGKYVLCGLRSDGQITFERPLPARGHAAAAHPQLPEAVAFARRPGRFAIVLECVSGREKARLIAPTSRHFYGHGAFSADGRLLFTSENDFEAARGIVGVWDVGAGYRRVGEFASGGIGPHDIRLMPDGASLAIANGGIETHPDTGRTKLNLPTMRSNLTFLGLDGEILEQVELGREYQRNSIRHLAITANATVAFGTQWQGDVSDQVPLLGTFRPGADITPKLANASMFRDMNAYVGSITANKEAVVATSPRGGVVLEVSADSLGLAHRHSIRDVCGVAPVKDGFVCTSGEGRVVALGKDRTATQHIISWDNHLVSI